MVADSSFSSDTRGQTSRGWRGHRLLMSAEVSVTLSATKGLGISLANAGILRSAQNDAGGADIAS